MVERHDHISTHWLTAHEEAGLASQLKAFARNILSESGADIGELEMDSDQPCFETQCLTPKQLVNAVTKATDGWNYGVISIGYPGPSWMESV